MERRGYFSQKFGGQYMPEVLMNSLADMEGEHEFVAKDHCFTNELDFFSNNYGGRKSVIYKARMLSKKYGPDIYFKREDLLFNGGSSFQAIAGQIIIGKRIGRRVVLIPALNIQHALTASSLAAAMGMMCEVFISEKDALAYEEEINKMKLTDAFIFTVKGNYQDVLNEAKKRWILRSPVTVFIETRAAGPHPYPSMIEAYQSVIGKELKEQFLENCGKLPELIVSSLIDDASAAGVFPVFESEDVKLAGVEMAEYPVYKDGKDGVFNGMRSLFILDDNGDAVLGNLDGRCCDIGAEPHIAAMVHNGRLDIADITRDEAIKAAIEIASVEGIMLSENSAYAVAYVLKQAKNYGLQDNIAVIISGKADKNWIKICTERKASDESVK